MVNCCPDTSCLEQLYKPCSIPHSWNIGFTNIASDKYSPGGLLFEFWFPPLLGCVPGKIIQTSFQGIWDIYIPIVQLFWCLLLVFLNNTQSLILQSFHAFWLNLLIISFHTISRRLISPKSFFSLSFKSIPLPGFPVVFATSSNSASSCLLHWLEYHWKCSPPFSVNASLSLFLCILPLYVTHNHLNSEAFRVQQFNKNTLTPHIISNHKLFCYPPDCCSSTPSLPPFQKIWSSLLWWHHIYEKYPLPYKLLVMNVSTPILLLMSKNYICVANEKYVLDQWEAFSHSCMVVISFHFLLQSSESYWPFGLFGFLIEETH